MERKHSPQQPKSPEKVPSEMPPLPVRPINEDDDGYDPYCDRSVQDALWEEDPWR